MPLLISRPAGFTTTGLLPVASVYALICQQSYDIWSCNLSFSLAYYASEAAYDARAAPLEINALPPNFAFKVAPAQTVYISEPFAMMEQHATATLLPLLGEGATIDTVP